MVKALGLDDPHHTQVGRVRRLTMGQHRLSFLVVQFIALLLFDLVGDFWRFSLEIRIE